MVVGRVSQKGALLVSCLGVLCLAGSQMLRAEQTHDLVVDLLALVPATAALAAVVFARSWSKRHKLEAAGAGVAGTGAATFRADQALPLAEPPAARVTLAERLVFFMLLALLGGIGAVLPWAQGAAVVAAIAFAVLMARDMVVRRGMSLALAPFYGLTLACGYSLFILAGGLAGAVVLTH